MKQHLPPILYWAPRVLGVAMVIFISLFALDVFQEGYGIGELIVALVMHLIPTFLIIGILVLAWRWEWVGALFFVALGIFYIIMTWHKFSWMTWAIISGPLFLIGILFAVNWFYRKR